MLLTNKFKETDNVFNASHPFLFFVEEQSTGSLLFAGKVENPLETESQFPYRYGEEDTVQGKLLRSVSRRGSYGTGNVFDKYNTAKRDFLVLLWLGAPFNVTRNAS